MKKTIQCKVLNKRVTLAWCEPTPGVAACQICESQKKLDVPKVTQPTKQPGKQNKVEAEELKSRYRLYFEYLRRSDDYKKYCEYRRARLNNPKIAIPQELIKNRPDRFICVYDFWGDIHSDSFSFDDWWNNTLDKLKLWEAKTGKRNLVEDYTNIVEDDIDYCRSHYWDQKGLEPDLDDLKSFFPQWLKSYGYAYIRVNLVGGSTDVLEKQFTAFVKKHRKDPIIKQLESNSRYVSELSLNNFRKDELQTYLDVYDLSEKKKLKIKDIVKKKEPGLDSENEDVQRVFYKYLEKAEKIIKNAENGLFPGNYQ